MRGFFSRMRRRLRGRSRGVRPGDVWRDHLGIEHRVTARDLWSGDGFDI